MVSCDSTMCSNRLVPRPLSHPILDLWKWRMPGKEAKVYAVLKPSVLSAINYGGVLPFDIAGKLRSL